MKKQLSLLLAVCMCLPLCFSLASCDFTLPSHSYDTAWSSNDTHHWHACTDEGCTAFSDKAEHVWGDATGADMSICSVCLATKVDDTPTPGVDLTEEEWSALQQSEKFENITMRLVGTFLDDTADGEPFDTVIKITPEAVAVDDEVSAEAEMITAVKNVYLDTILAMLKDFSDYEHDAENHLYRAKEDIVYDVTVMEASATITATDVTLKINADHYISEISCNMKQDLGSEIFLLQVTFSFSNFGTTVVEATE